MKSSLFSALLFCVGLMSVMVTGEGREPDCCLTVTNTRVPVKNIEDYEIQESTGVCAVRAVRFITRKGINICSDPDDSWAIRAINDVNCRKNKEPCVKSTTCFTSTTNMIPTRTTTNTTPTPETETSTSTTASTKVTRIETSGPKTETSTTTTQQTSVSKEKPKLPSSIVKTCGTSGPTAPPTETTHKTPRKDTDQTTSSTTKNRETTSTETTTSPPKTKPSKLKIKILSKKSKKRLRKYQYKPQG